jgi:ferritin-like metal-binding protein YciE
MLAENLSDIFQRGLEFPYDYEEQLLKALPKMSESISAPDLNGALGNRAEKCKRHSTIIEKIFSGLNRATAGRSNHSVSSILGEGEKLIRHIDKSPLLDASLLITANLVAHNGEGLYGSLAGVARALNLAEAERLVSELLADERAWIAALEQVAPNLNQSAVGVVNTPHGFVII